MRSGERGKGYGQTLTFNNLKNKQRGQKFFAYGGKVYFGLAELKLSFRNIANFFRLKLESWLKLTLQIIG